ncbi:MAG: NUDIX hydrolase [Acidobacteria bacterium]|nr:NUDIX hydrolase [Acidobacteriota bacterium]
MYLAIKWIFAFVSDFTTRATRAKFAGGARTTADCDRFVHMAAKAPDDSARPQLLASETIYEGRVFDITLDSIREGPLEYTREIIRHKGSAVIIPIFDDGRIALVRQYRHAAREFLLELPAGTLNNGEDPLEGARRELEEEIGVTAENIDKLCEFYVSPGFLTEKMHLFAARGLTATAQNLDADEVLSIEYHTLDDLSQMARDGRIQDAKTLVGISILAAGTSVTK